MNNYDFRIAKVKLDEKTRQWVVLRCPYCGRQHRHGAGRPGDDPRQFLGPRVQHCDQPNASGYELVEEK